jgi:hypothetical protein
MNKHRRAFSLPELIAAVAVAAIICVLMSNVMNRVISIWSQSVGHIQKRDNVRVFLESISSDLRSALLPICHDPSMAQSNLQFVLNPPNASLSQDILNPSAVFWTATTASKRTYGDVALVGYFLRYRENDGGGPSTRLCRFFVNPEDTATASGAYKIYDPADRFAWFVPDILDNHTSAQAPEYRGMFVENVIGFWVRCLDPANEVITRTARYTRTNGSLVDSMEYPPGTYDSMQGYRYERKDNGETVDVPPPSLPSSVEVSVVFLDSQSIQRLSAADVVAIRRLYALTTRGSELSRFIEKLPASVRPWARPFTVQIELTQGGIQ